jgi:hypothetical protein
MPLQCRYIEAFRFGRALLIWGGADELLALADTIERLPSAKAYNMSCEAATGEPFRGRTCLAIVSISGPPNALVETKGHTNFVSCSINRDICQEWAAKLRELCAGSGGAHQYLDLFAEQPFDIVASLGEYPPGFPGNNQSPAKDGG